MISIHSMEVDHNMYIYTQTGAVPDRSDSTFGYGVIFPVGVRASADVQRQLQIEANSYGDILQADFVDSYRNLTLKMLSSLRYLSLAFQKEVVVLKIDSDVGWRIQNVTGYIKTVIDTTKTGFHCYR
ncbi:hypothetical protein ANCCAN_15699 [Ancylostoma caninum]|uniref:Hexosyltransferase n=1 Tax=Ancylostoma caninum TaxID=29170 RepID=A0A368G1N3_ANCCA|nr:hypothetical protein ANCCAN_15699 [Ancylostoma caninum]